MRPQLTHKHVRSVVPLLLAPLQHLWLRPLDLLLSDAIQIPVYLFPQNTNCLLETAFSPSRECFPKGFPTLSIIIALLAEVVGQLSDCYSPHYTDSRPQLSSRFHEGECHTSKPPHLWRPVTQQTELRSHETVLVSHQTLYYFCIDSDQLKIPYKNLMLHLYLRIGPNPSHSHCHSLSRHAV